MECNARIMSPTTSESDDDMLSKDQVDSPSFDEGSCEGSPEVGSGLKKGPWTSAEDAILVDYVRKHGEGNWNSVQKHSGLYRCGKSCRLRWANHLRPNLKKGAFTSEEEQLIIQLHAKMGNKWARMAAHLPGRTDNEIKNYWNTRIKRRQRAGLPLYPPDVCLQQVLNENHQARNTNEFNCGDTPHHIMQASNYDIPDVIFDHLKSNQGLLAYIPPLPDISIGGMLNESLGSSQNYSFMSSTMHRPKRLRGSEILYPGFNSSAVNGFAPVDQFQIDAAAKVNQPFGLSFPYDPDPNGKNPSAFGVLPGSHALLNGNFSASKPTSGSLKLELPSLQYPEMELGSWGTSSPQPPSLDCVDAFIQSPSSSRLVPDCLSPRNSGLLDALLHESQALGGTKNQSSEKSSSSCVVTPGDIVDSSTLNCETEWEEYGEPLSPLCRSAASVFNESTPVSGNSLDEPPAPRGLSGYEVKTEPVYHDTSPDEKKQIPTNCSFRPDAYFDGASFDQSYECAKDQSILTEALSAFTGEDICGDYKPKFTESSSLSQGWCPSLWNNLPAVCQVSEHP